jgi:hypothetical protein
MGTDLLIAFHLLFMCSGVLVIDFSELLNLHFRDSEELAEVEAELVGNFHNFIMSCFGLWSK